MKVLDFIQGAGGGGGGGGSEASDTVRGTQTFDVLDLISEGECEGLVNGLKSIYLDGVPLQAADGSMNFDNVQIQTTPGTQGQAAIAGVDGVQNEVGVGINVLFATPVVRSITNPAIDTCRVTIIVPQLSKADPTTGDLGGSSFEWSIEVQSNGGGYVQVFRETIAEKTMSRYPCAALFKLPGSAPWDVKVRRISADSTSSNEVNAFAWSTYTEIQTVKLRYPNSCLIRSRGNAAQFGRIPVRSFDWLGERIQVPSNYDPKTRVYTGVWDGTFKIAWTDNPAWQYHDMVANNRYGLGRYVQTTDAFKWELYTIARYCDELVPDGYGGAEPRFRASPGFETREQAYKVLTDMAAIFRGIVFWLNEDVSLAQDSPIDPVVHYAPANVMGEPGRKFAYTGSSNGKRYSSVIVWFNDLTQQGKLIPEVVIDADLEAELGVKPLELSPLGVWSRGQAHRIGQWVLYTQERETEAVTFKVGLDGVLTAPGKVFQVSDPHEAGDRMAGRVSAATTSNITLDADVVFEPGRAYTLTVMLRDAIDATKLVPQQRAVLNPAGTWRMLTMAAPFSAAPARETMWLLESDRLVATSWRCIGATDNSSENSFTLTGIAHEPKKYDLIERGIDFQKAPISRISLNAPQVTNIRFVETPYLSGSVLRSKISVSWETSRLGLTFLVGWRINDGPVTDIPETSSNTVDIDGPPVGKFEVTVRSRNVLGLLSAPVTATTTLIVSSEVFAEWADLVGIPANIAGLTGSEAIRNADLVIGAVNLLTLSTNFATFSGGTNTSIILAINQPDPTGGGSASRISFTGNPAGERYRHVTGLRAGGTYTASVWVKRQDGANFCLSVTDGSSWATSKGVASTAALNVWSRLVVTFTTSTGALDMVLGGHSCPGLVAQSAATVLLAFAQLEDGNTATQWSLAPDDISAIIATAQQTANDAKTQITAIADNNVLDRGEKPDVLLDWLALNNEQAGIDAQATEFGITTEKAAYDSAKNTLALYLQSLGPGGINGWQDTTVDTPIVRVTFVNTWAAVYTARQTLLNKISKVAGTIAAWAGVNNRPQDLFNMVLTPTFESGSGGTWNHPAVAVSGSAWRYALLLDSRDLIEDNPIPVRGGERLFCAADLASRNAYTVAFGVVCYNLNGTIIAFLAGVVVAPGQGFVRQVGPVDLPLATVVVKPWLQINGPPGDPSLLQSYATNLYLGRAEPGATLGADWATNVTGAAGVNAAIAAAQAAASNAAIAAAAAQASAISAQAELTAIDSDSLLTAGEKPTVIRDYSVLITEQGGIDAQATNYGVTTEKANYDAAMAALISYLGTLNSPTYWDDLNGSTTIVGSTFRARFIAVYTARQGVLDKVSANAKARLGALATQNTVGTPSIDRNAVNTPVSTYVPSSVGIGGAQTVLGSISIATSGEPVNIIGGATLRALLQPSSAGSCALELWRDGTLLSSGGAATFLLPSSGFATTTLSQSSSTPPYRDNPGAGTFTYYLKASPTYITGSAMSWSAINIGVIAIEVKR